MVKLEIFYTVIPLAIVAVLFTLNLDAQRDLSRLSRDPAVKVDVKGFQWQWRFRYPGEHVTVTGTPDRPAELVLPVGETVRFHLVATDVIHSFWVPEFLEKRDLIPGVDNRIEVYVKRPGTWVGRCAEYCGLSHWQMSFTVRAVAPAEFARWSRAAAALPQPVIGSTRAPAQPATTETTTP
jgi:cytochrome c oxidase subunit 2